MSKIKKLLKVVTLGLAFSTTPMEKHKEEEMPPTLNQYQFTSERSINNPALEEYNQITPNFEGFLSYLEEIDTNREINNPLDLNQLNKLKSEYERITSTPEKKLTQKEKDFRMYYNRHIYSLEKPHILNQISSILKAETPDVTVRTDLQVLQERIRDGAYNTTRTHNSSEPLIFYPSENDKSLNLFILNNITNPKEISNNAIKYIHPSYYRFIVALLLIENNFGNTTTSSANAQGPFQIKPQTQEFVRSKFNLTSKHSNDVNSLGFLNIFLLAKIFDINVNKEPSKEEVILLSWTYFQGINSYSNLYAPNNSTLTKLREYPYKILLVMQHPELFQISQEVREEKEEEIVQK